MAPNSTGWWTDEKVDGTVTSQYVHSHLRPSEAEQLTKSAFGDLSDDTYLEWILTRSKRFFLTLVDAGVPDQIFGIINDSWDDEDLPIPEDEVPDLLLSQEPDKTLDRRFYKAQFKYLIRVVGDGEHIRYAQEETVPVNPLGLKPVINKAKDGFDKVKLPSHKQRIFARRRMDLRNRHMEEELLAEMAEWRIFAHEHILSIYGSYTTEDSLFVLMTPAPEYSLKAFLNDTPKVFETLPKFERKKLVLSWSHCLANGLSWIHGHGKHHGAIRPSRVLIDERFNIYLGQFDGNGILCDSTVKDDIEAYQYAAPERWKRSVTIQATGNARAILPSGGRTARRVTTESERTSSTDRPDGHSSSIGSRLDTTRPTSVSYVFSPTSKNGSRLRLGSAKSAVSRMGSTLKRSESRQMSHMTDGMRPIRTSLEAHARPGASPVLSSHSNESAHVRRQTGPIYAAAPEIKTAVVQTWASAQHDQLAADIFSLGAIIMDIITFLSKHSNSSFTRHRASKNKSAGRGGGLADASFHANIGQVIGWADILQKDAEKRIKKEDGAIYKAIGPCLQVVLQCLDREPSERFLASELQKKLCEHLRDFAGLDIPQCCLDGEVDRSEIRPRSRAAAADLMRQGASSRQQLHRGESKLSPRPESEIMEKPVVSTFSPRIDSLKMSPANFNTFNFDIDNAPSTMVASEAQADDKFQPRPDSFAFATGEGVEVFPRPPTANSTSKRRQLRTETGGEQTSPTSPVSVNHGVNFHGLNSPRSAAASTIGISEDYQSVYSYTPPPTAGPTRELPPVPRSANLKNAGLTSNPPSGRSASRPVQPSAPEEEPTALPALPSIDKHNINNLHSSVNSNSARSQNRRSTSRMEDVDEISAVESSTNPNPNSNQRHYRSSSRQGMNDGRLYVSHLGREKLALRGLQYP